jgi:molybdopterin converting factor small subunit
MKIKVKFFATYRELFGGEGKEIELESGKIAFAALDVMTKEPPKPDNPLLGMDNVIITPHFAWYSERSERILGEKAAKEMVRVFQGYFPKSLINPEVIKLRPDLKQVDDSQGRDFVKEKG